MKYIIFSIFLLCVLGVEAQLTGIVYGRNAKTKEAIIGAKVQFIETNIGAITDNDGKFEIVLPDSLPRKMAISAIGYLSDTVLITKKDKFTSLEITLFSDLLLDEIIIQARLDGTSINRLNPLLVEQISSNELRKAACCNLSESFETNASVDVSITDAVSGAKRIQMMGLDGIYTQIQIENIPALRGLESSFGLNSIPGTWVESMQITKGSGNVVNGYESMAGLINIEFKKPEEMEKLYLNGYGNIFGRYEFNTHSGIKLNNKWSTGIFAHASTNTQEVDNNNDGFRDLPLGTLFSGMNRWKYTGEKFESQFGIRAYYEDKSSGQLNAERNSQNLYGTFLNQKSFDAFAKTGFLFKSRFKSLGVIYNAKYQKLDFLAGNKTFSGEEKRGYINVLFDDIIGSTIHKYKIGTSIVYQDINQKLDSLQNDRVEYTPGIYGEYTYTGIRFTGVVGARYDYDNLFKHQFTPRFHGKVIINENTDFRVTAGRGWRVPNYMIDNLSLMVSSRLFIPTQELRPEVSYNFGGSFVQRYSLFGRKSTLTLDYYHTLFTEQLIVDRDASQYAVYFRNLSGRSFSNAFQAEWMIEPFRNFVVRLAYKYLEVKAVFDDKLQQKVMVPKHRGFVNLAYITRNKKWEFDFTANYRGEARLTAVEFSSDNKDYGLNSKAYALFNSQITYNYKKLSVYLGGENLGNFKQKNAIVDAQNPFGSTFDATRIWAPVMGTNIYLGFRYQINKTKK